MYLPQFHETELNNQWWGKGFTEWTAVQGAEPLFEGHKQPKIPLGNNYYNLLDKKTFNQQSELMKRFGIDGQCFYHYYFKNGQKVLEKPAENLLKWKDVKIPFCFSWANESWVSTWSRLRNGNVWKNSDSRETHFKQESEILLEQDYGNEKDWKEHFEYLLPFFKDERYIRKDDKPVFLIYKPMDIPCLREMIDVWNKLSCIHGLKGIYFIGTNTNPNGLMDDILFVEPQGVFANYFSNNYFEHTVKKRIDGRELSERIVERASLSNGICCGTPGFDNSPRKGMNSFIVTNLTPEVFFLQIQSLLAISRKKEKDFLFINAWNEWGEGMYLEPDEESEYSYLNSVKEAKSCLLKESLIQVKHGEERDIASDELQIEKYRKYWQLFDRWMTAMEKKIDVASYFVEKNMHNIAVYGIGMMGQHFISQMEESEVEVSYGLDAKAKMIHESTPVYALADGLPHVDCVVICVTYDQMWIKERIEEYVEAPIITIDEVIEYLLQK